MDEIMEKGWINEALVDEMFEIVLAFEHSGKIRYGNRSAIECLGYDKDELLECNMNEIFWQEYQQDDGQSLPFDREQLRSVQETVMYRKNSSCFPVAVRYIATNEEIEYLLAEDITRRKNMDVRVRELKAREEKNMRVRNEFVANVTHELRTPVNGIKGHVTTLLEKTETEEQKKILDIILYCCDNMSSIINNILDFSKMEAGKFSLEAVEFDFHQMMEQVIATHIAEVNKKELRLSLHVDETIPQYIIGDKLRIGQILNNLLSNAAKFTLVGQISVDVSKTMHINDEIELFFMVKDSGIGISKEEQDKLFQSFNQADPSITRRFGGTGLGLAITKQLVEQMNGTIHVESEKGKGSSFTFNLKLKTNQLASDTQDQNLEEAYSKWSNLSMGMRETSQIDYLEFGSEENRKEIRKRMEKLVLSIELGSWDKAETLAETIKALVRDAGDDMKKPILQMEMGIRKENYDRSIKAYEKLNEIIEAKLNAD